MSQLIQDWRQAQKQMEKLVANQTRIIGNESVKVVKQNFIIQGYDTGTGVKAWDERKPSTNKAYDKRHGVKGSVYNSGNPLLLQTRNLYNAVKYKASNKLVQIGVDLGLIPYAEKMNETRQYIPTETEGPNRKILGKVKDKIKREQDLAMQNFKK